MLPKALIITGYGINCEEETALCFKKAGARSEIVHVNDLIDGYQKMASYQILVISGGFSYGDDTGSGNALANRIRNNLENEIFRFVRMDKLAIGICNGFQVIVNLGLVPALDGKYGDRQTALDRNDSARYIDRWVRLKRTSEKCVWTKGIGLLHVPVAHGEGKFTISDENLKKLRESDQIAWQYARVDGSLANGQWPFNPNGSMADIAGVCDPTGRILGMMPHPERFIHPTNEDGWTLKKELARRARKEMPEEGAGMQVFRNAVGYFA